MERIAGFETLLQKRPSLRLRRSRIYRGPFRGELRSSLEAPVAEGLGDVPMQLIAAEILEQSPPNDLADLRLIVSDKILRYASHNFRNSILPLLVPLGRIDVPARQANYKGTPRLAGHRDCHVIGGGENLDWAWAVPSVRSQQLSDYRR